ncbi:AraC family transcriptional regulator [Steroidobacter agaridevorans]|uniref:AraC family transcriptional regulator n=1 Tax=Steroidobacter agaridevorans TaxID=2695856 RepID=A0A829YKK9_9GAMM|nr:helix-turn-helix domain-containing protein [Steroidobacter agaridevorans]GFE83845.1 AraC family transcriptional regulator [Steroidobacter agaridevorans]
MTSAPAPSTFTVRQPAPGLARYVSQYWLSLNNTSPVYAALPDGCVDLVLEVTASRYRSWIYGSTTRPTAIPCTAGTHYLGIRFHPGQSRHFISIAAQDITDGREDLRSLMQFPSEHVAAHIAAEALFDELDQILLEVLRHTPPVRSYIDGVVQHIETHRGHLRIDDVAARFGKSRRQMERVFLQTVGVPLKFFCMISRLRHAADLIVHPASRSLTAAAHDAGYSDQAHMTRDFTRLAGVSPGQLRADDAFFQYHSPR